MIDSGCAVQIIVMLDIQFVDPDSSKKLLFWRAFADLGIAMRFLTVRAMSRIVCDNDECNILTNGL
jgi:hypothetical protein